MTVFTPEVTDESVNEWILVVNCPNGLEQISYSNPSDAHAHRSDLPSGTHSWLFRWTGLELTYCQ